MTDISTFYTQQAAQAPTSTGNNSPLFKKEKKSAADFLDLLMANFLPPKTEAVLPSVKPPFETLPPILEAELPEGPIVPDNFLPPGTVGGPEFANLPAPVDGEPAPLTWTVSNMPTPLDLSEDPIEPPTIFVPSIPQLTNGQEFRFIPVVKAPVERAIAEMPVDVVDPIITAAPAGDVPEAPAPGSSPKVTAEIPEPTNDIAKQLNAMTIGAAPQEKGDKDARRTRDILSDLLAPKNNHDAYQPTITTTRPDNTAPQPVTGRPGGGTGLTPLTLLEPVFASPIAPLGGDGLTGAPMGSEASTTSLTQTLAASARAPASSTLHGAALQAVALHMNQLGQNRDTRSLTLQLNPPELGKLQVKMTFGKDKTVKADILIEKSETFHLMQKDSDNLKTALTDAGLQADAGSLNFSLADHGTFQGEKGSEAFMKLARGANDNGNDVIGAYEIKSSEQWSVDPATGITRYNIIV